MKIGILALGAMLAISTSVATAQAPAKDKGSTQEKKRDKDSWGEKHGQKKSDDVSDGKGDGRWGAQRRLLGGIKLTDAQKTSIKAIHTKYEPRISAIRDTVKMNRKANATATTNDALRTRAQALAAQERAEIRAVLTAEQQTRFDQNVAKFDDRMDKRRGDRGKRGDRGDRSR